MNKIFFVILLLLTVKVNAQQIDTIFDKGIYKSYFSYELREPLYVSYTLYKGGGNCKRLKRFKNDSAVYMVDDDEYKNSGYDRGHLANSEDFAYNCDYSNLTYRFYNCIPQTPNLNRGIWKVWESIIRENSQNDSLFITTGGIWHKKTFSFNHDFVQPIMPIPDKCWKIVYSLKTKKILYALIFSNNVTKSDVKKLSIAQLLQIIPYKVNYTP